MLQTHQKSDQIQQTFINGIDMYVRTYAKQLNESSWITSEVTTILLSSNLSNLREPRPPAKCVSMSWPLYDVKYCRKINLSLQMYVISNMKKFKNVLYVSFLFASRSHSKTIVARIQYVKHQICTYGPEKKWGTSFSFVISWVWKITVERVKMFFCTDFLVNKSSSYDLALDWVTYTSTECVTFRFWIDGSHDYCFHEDQYLRHRSLKVIY